MTRKRHVTGFIVVAAVLGASVGRRLTTETVREIHGSVTYTLWDYVVPYVVAGALIGAAVGIAIELFFEESVTLTWTLVLAIIMMVLLYFQFLLPPYTPP